MFEFSVPVMIHMAKFCAFCNLSIFDGVTHPHRQAVEQLTKHQSSYDR